MKEQNRKLIGQKIALPVLLLTCIAFEIWVGFFSLNREQDSHTEELYQVSTGIAQAIDPQRIVSLLGGSRGDFAVDSLQLHDQLNRVSQYFSSIQALRLYSQDSSGKVQIVLESVKDPSKLIHENNTQRVSEVLLHNRVSSDEFSGTDGPILQILIPLVYETHSEGQSRETGVLEVIHTSTLPQEVVYLSALPSVLLTFWLLFLFVLGSFIFKSRRNDQDSFLWSNMETIITFLFGAGVSIFIAWNIHSAALREHKEQFKTLADTRVQVLLHSLKEFETIQLEALGRYFETSEVVTAKEFLDFSSFLEKSSFVKSWLWIPIIHENALDSLNQVAKSEGRDHFGIWEVDGNGNKREVRGRSNYYPVFRIVPESEQEMEGFDLASDVLLKGALFKALNLKKSTASDLETNVYCFRPVYHEHRKSVLGSAAAILSLEKLLEYGHPDDMVDVEISQISAQGKAERVGYRGKTVGSVLQKSGNQYPLFLFDRTYLISTYIGQEFKESNPIYSGIAVGVAALFFTVVLSGVVFLISRHRLNLESEVEGRTRELHDSEKKFRLLFEDSPDAFLVIEEGVITECNRVSEKMIGGAKQDLVGKRPDEISPEKQGEIPSIEASREHMEKAIKNGTHQFEWVHKRVDGSEFWAETSLSLTQENDKQKLLVSWRDITERKSAEKELAEASGRISALLTAIPAQVYLKDMALKYITANATYCESLNTTPEELHGKSDYDFLSKSAAEESVKEDSWILKSGQAVVNKEGIIVNEDGSAIWGLVNKYPVRDREDNIIGLVGHVIDVTERKIDSERIRETLEETERINRLMSGREDRVMELKDEVNELLKILGQEPKYRRREE